MNIKIIVFCILTLMTCLIFSADKPKEEMGHLTILTGPMYSGKTTALIELIKANRETDHTVAVYSHCLDARKDNQLCSRALPDENIDAFKTADPKDIVKDYMRGDFNCVAIDEAQFFPSSLCSFVYMMLECRCKVYISGLDMNFKGLPFGTTMGGLCQMADKVIKLKAICKICGQHNATMTQRLVNGKPASEKDEELIIEGSKDTVIYEPRCRNCHKIS